MSETRPGGSAAGPGWGGRLVHSVRFRITAVAAIAVAVVLVVAGVLLLVAQQRQLTDNLDASLARRADDLELAVRDLAVPTADRPVVLVNGSGDDAVVQLVSVLDGTLVAATANAADAPPIAADPSGADDTFRTLTDLPVEDDEYRVLSRRIDVASDRYDLHVAQNTDEQRDVIAELRNTVLVTIPIAVLVLAGVVWWLVGRTLKPVEAIRREVADMGAGELDRRVPQPGTGDEIDRLAVTMNELIGRLESATERQQQFVADASHELRSPLARMRTELEVEAAAPAERRRSVGDTYSSVIQEIDEMTALVDDLLVLARSDAGRASVDGRPVDLDDLVLDEVTRARAASGDVSIDRSGVSAALVLGDPGELRRVVRNLLDNAVRHAAASVTVALVEEPSQSGGNRALLTIADDGPGIDADHAASIFDRFTRLDDARTRSTGGTGLGLAIARDIVERHGGVLTLDASPAAGARFVAAIPTVDPPVAG